MIKFLSLFLSLFFVSFCWGQAHLNDSYSFSLNGNKISPQDDFKTSLKSLKLDETDITKAVILQFNSIPNVEEQK